MIDLAQSPAADLAGREFWSGVLQTGGFTAIPRWSAHPSPGVGEHELKVPEDCVASLRSLAAAMNVHLSSVFLAAHVRVLASLSGERDVCTGYARQSGAPLPCRISTQGRSWKDLLLDTAHVHSQLLAHRDFPVDDLRVELGLTEPVFEAAFELHGDSGKRLAKGTVLRVTFLNHDQNLLRLHYRTDVLDGDAAARIAGYHLAALSLIAADPDAVHSTQTLLSTEEIHSQQVAFAGRQKARPDKRAHEIFEEQARLRPLAVAARLGDKQLTYGALNARANQLARALRARGVDRETVVGVVTERNLDWMTAVLAILKAGGVYLPIEPHFPPDRMDRMLARSECRLVLTEAASSAQLDQAIAAFPFTEKLLIEAALLDDHGSTDLGIPVAPDQLAYIFFTSGSTGEPKGAMCEHAGMVNHLFAKIEDLHIGEGDSVAQTAPQCFDISLWQLLSAVLVGGRTVLVDQDTILDAERFIKRITDERVAVVQVVPSYLDVLVSYLAAHPRQMPTLRCVSATGEALKAELAERWFEVQPDVRLLNAYGLTETSDDTNHEILTQPPADGRVPLGRPISNVRISIVDEHLGLVPLGAPGEIVFSGVCVGRGYINDPERTKLAFLPDPDSAGGRRYRSGDYGRWRADGKLEFLGRRDAQVKVNGFRIEIGEVENRLLGLETVRDGAVVVTDRSDGSKQLVGFYASDRPLAPASMIEQLGASLPAYMVPAVIHWREQLPMTGNGKIDKKALATLAKELDEASTQHEEPWPGTETWLAKVWGEVLGIAPEQISRHSNFFEIGGTSLSAVRLAIALGRAVSFKGIATHPVLSDQAAVLDRASWSGAASAMVGSHAK